MSTEDSEEVGSCNRPSAEAANLKPLVSAFLHPVRTDSCPASFAHFFSEVSVHPDISKFLELAAADEQLVEKKILKGGCKSLESLIPLTVSKVRATRLHLSKKILKGLP